MNIQLFIDNKEIEITESIQFPLNRTFGSLSNPSEIHIDYSKSIAIPATKRNNRILGNAYRLDKAYSNTLALDFDPLQRIPAQLRYNGTIILDGYMKYVSSKINKGVAYYNMNLYGAIGDVFKKLQNVVLSADKLSDEQKSESDGGAKYILNDKIYDYRVIGKDLVKDCWNYEGEPLADGNYPTTIIGFAPAYRGLYDDFESNSIVGLETVSISDGTPKDVAEVFKQEWIVNLKDKGFTQEDAEKRVDALDFSSIIGPGINEHALRQFRSYEQKPYVYFCKLMQMYQDKCKEITDYEIVLDQKWFNANNPYWTRLCYMFDYLAGRGVNTDNTTPFSGYSNGAYTSTAVQNTLKWYGRNVTYTDFTTTVTNAGQVKTAPFNVLLINKKVASDADPLWSGKADIYNSVVILSPRAHVTCNITFTNSAGQTKTFYWWGAENKDNVTPIAPSQYKESNFNQVYNETVINHSTRTLTGTTALPIPAMDLGAFNTNGLKVTIGVQVWYPQSSTNEYEIYRAPFIYRYRLPIKAATVYNQLYIEPNNNDFTVTFPNTEMYCNWRYTTTCALKNLYTKDEPLFNVILEYTKMFGLIWKPDYINKKIHLMTRQSYFGDYQIVDWTDKFDGSKDCIIEPCSFNSKYVDFNYESVDGYRYKGYKNRYGVEYGGKHIKTRYDFDGKTTTLFDKMHPSSISTKSFVGITDLIMWDTTSPIERSKSEIDFIDCEDLQQEKSITMNNWYFRGNNYTPTESYYISDVSDKERADGKYYWLANSYGLFEDDKPLVRTKSIPQFGITYNTSDYQRNSRLVGCTFNCPSEDFTEKKEVSAAQGNYIYDLCWRDFINERYNSNNKKVTAYFNLSMTDYQSFSFNTFVMFNNQLFVVNKIIDFNPNTNATTKVELIQVSDINGYVGQSNLFPAMFCEDEMLSLSGTAGSKTFKVRCYPSPDEHEVVHETTLDAGEYVYIEDKETDGLYVYYTLVWEGLSTSAPYKGKVVLTTGNETLEIPIEIN